MTTKDGRFYDDFDVCSTFWKFTCSTSVVICAHLDNFPHGYMHTGICESGDIGKDCDWWRKVSEVIPEGTNTKGRRK